MSWLTDREESADDTNPQEAGSLERQASMHHRMNGFQTCGVRFVRSTNNNIMMSFKHQRDSHGVVLTNHLDI